MEATKFDSSDEPYLDWIANHPEGLVLNTERGPSATYARFHHPHCSHISKPGDDFRPDGFTKYQRIKVCAEESAPLVDWLIKNRPNAVVGARPCKSCEPEIEEIGLYQYPDEEDETETYEEGSRQTVTVNRYERNRAARKKCLDHYGAQCQVCGLRFEKRYGEIGKGRAGIHVHHEIPVASNKKSEIHPVDDLKPVCPNCHAMLHQKDPPFTIAELREKLRSQN